MKETGLMFKAPLVRAILSGQKTQTRRVVKPQPTPCTHAAWPTNWVAEGNEWHCAVCGNGHRLNPRAKSGVSGINCPMGQPGDRIYVRETHWAWGRWETRYSEAKGRDEWHFVDMTTECGRPYLYEADGVSQGRVKRTGGMLPTYWKRPGILMPKTAARIWLEVTGVRVERLQQITEEDAKAEGAHGGHDAIPGYQYSATPLEHFRHIWESTGGDWAANPWVWVIDFRILSTIGRPQ